MWKLQNLFLAKKLCVVGAALFGDLFEIEHDELVVDFQSFSEITLKILKKSYFKSSIAVVKCVCIIWKERALHFSI